jgi:hypothetical protein
LFLFEGNAEARVFDDPLAAKNAAATDTEFSSSKAGKGVSRDNMLRCCPARRRQVAFNFNDAFH